MAQPSIGRRQIVANAASEKPMKMDVDARGSYRHGGLIIPVQPKFTQQRLVLTIDVGHALERRHDQHGEAGQHVVGKCGEGWPCTDSAASKAAPEVQATRGIGLPTLSSAAARKAARGPFAIVVGFLLYGSGV